MGSKKNAATETIGKTPLYMSGLLMSRDELHAVIQRVDDKVRPRSVFKELLAVALQGYLCGDQGVRKEDLAEALGEEPSHSLMAGALLRTVRQMRRDLDFWKESAGRSHERIEHWRNLYQQLLDRVESAEPLSVDEVVELRKMSDQQFSAYLKIRRTNQSPEFARRWVRETVGVVGAIGQQGQHRGDADLEAAIDERGFP